jgi:hypothetical protein
MSWINPSPEGGHIPADYELCELDAIELNSEDKLVEFLNKKGIQHSCDPNAWFAQGGSLLKSRKAIDISNDNITVDYCTFALFESIPEISVCTCNSTNCRGVVGKNDYKRPELRVRYEGHNAAFFEPVVSKYFDDPLNILSKLHPAIELRSCELGRGLFATRKIKEGEVVWYDPPSVQTATFYKISDVLNWEEEKRSGMLHFGYQVGVDAWEGVYTEEDALKDAAHFMNHSCDPSSWISEEDQDMILARRDILPGEEITYDYATSQTYPWPEELGYMQSCLCGSNLCRKKLKGDDYKSPELIKRYGKHFMKYIRELQANL